MRVSLAVLLSFAALASPRIARAARETGCGQLEQTFNDRFQCCGAGDASLRCPALQTAYSARRCGVLTCQIGVLQYNTPSANGLTAIVTLATQGSDLSVCGLSPYAGAGASLAGTMTSAIDAAGCATFTAAGGFPAGVYSLAIDAAAMSDRVDFALP